MYSRVNIQAMPFDLHALINSHENAHIGAMVTFWGKVRAFDQESPLLALEISHYPDVTESIIEEYIATAAQRWPILSCCIDHRVGRLQVGEVIVHLSVGAAHREAAFAAAEFLMDKLKTEAPFWKKEYLQNGESYWVEAKIKDAKASERWDTV